MAKIESLPVLLCLAVLACGDDSSEPGPEPNPDSSNSASTDAGGGTKPDATSPPVVDGASKPPPDAGTTTTPMPDAGDASKPDATATATSSTIEEPGSQVTDCLGDGCPEGMCGVSTQSCDGLYQDTLGGSYDFCPTGVNDTYCLVTCTTGNFNGACDFAKAEVYRLVDCSGAAPVITRCGRGQGCGAFGAGVMCTDG